MLTAGFLVLFVAAVAVLRTTAVAARHQAEAAADLAALATADGIGVDASMSMMCARGKRIATANGARMVSCTVRLDPSARSGTARVVTTVRFDLPDLGQLQARGRAEARRLPP